MLGEVWQRLTRLESHDLVGELFECMHSRKLSSNRTCEIRSAARQGREYFRQASTASQAVRPLLTFYGIASLSRSLTLLLRRNAAENSLTRGHGIETYNWPEILTSDIRASLAQISSLRVRTCGGLFSDLMGDTHNRICMHARSETVDWRIEYDPPPSGTELCIGDLLGRLPDLRYELVQANIPIRFTNIGDLSFTEKAGFSGNLCGNAPSDLISSYEVAGYVFDINEKKAIAADSQCFSENVPQFYHSYVRKMFGTIPDIHLVEPFNSKLRISQIGATYLVSYFLGMLARYFPTHWMALVDGGKGDRIWPALNRAQQYVETAYPQLIDEFIDDVITNPLPGVSHE